MNSSTNLIVLSLYYSAVCTFSMINNSTRILWTYCFYSIMSFWYGEAHHGWPHLTIHACMNPFINSFVRPSKHLHRRWKLYQRVSFLLFFQISYVDEVQMNFLRLLHNEAHQTFKYFCRNSVAWYNAETASYDSAVSLIGANGHDMPTERFSQKDVQLDGCSVSSPQLENIIIKNNDLKKRQNERLSYSYFTLRVFPFKLKFHLIKNLNLIHSFRLLPISLNLKNPP